MGNHEQTIIRIAHAIKFVLINLEFFTSPFTEQNAFKAWSDTYDGSNASSEASHLNEFMEGVIQSDRLIAYKNTILHISNITMENYEKLDVDYLAQFLSVSPSLLEMFEEIEREYRGLINAWYAQLNEAGQLSRKVRLAHMYAKEYAYSLETSTNKLSKQSDLTNDKLKVVNEAIVKLTQPNLDCTTRLNQFCEHLQNNIEMLSKRRDSGLITCLKSLALIGLTICSLGFYAKGAYHRLFRQATTGLLLLNESKAMINPQDNALRL